MLLLKEAVVSRETTVTDEKFDFVCIQYTSQKVGVKHNTTHNTKK